MNHSSDDDGRRSQTKATASRRAGAPMVSLITPHQAASEAWLLGALGLIAAGTNLGHARSRHCSALPAPGTLE